MRRALAETDRSVLWALIDNPRFPSVAITLMAEHHPDHFAALRAACSRHCPDDVGALVLARRVRTLVKHRIALAWAPYTSTSAARIDHDSFVEGLSGLHGRPQTVAVLAALLPVEQVVSLAEALRGDPSTSSAVAEVVLRRAHGADVDSNRHLVNALVIADAVPTRRTRSMAELRGGPLQAWVDLHDGSGLELFNRFDFSTVAGVAGSTSAGLLLTRASVEGSRDVLLQASLNPALDNVFVARHITGTAVAPEVIQFRCVNWDVDYVRILSAEIQSALDSDASLLHARVADVDTLDEVASLCRSPRAQRLVAGHGLCSVDTAMRLPAGAALEAFHDPGSLHHRIASKAGGAADAASTLSVEFSGTLAELIDVARGLVRD